MSQSVGDLPAGLTATEPPEIHPNLPESWLAGLRERCETGRSQSELRRRQNHRRRSHAELRSLLGSAFRRGMTPGQVLWAARRHLHPSEARAAAAIVRFELPDAVREHHQLLAEQAGAGYAIEMQEPTPDLRVLASHRGLIRLHRWILVSSDSLHSERTLDTTFSSARCTPRRQRSHRSSTTRPRAPGGGDDDGGGPGEQPAVTAGGRARRRSDLRPAAWWIQSWIDSQTIEARP
jgi:hypothetical protein